MPLTLSFPTGGALVIGGTGNVGQGIVRQLARASVPVLFTYRGSDSASVERAEALVASMHGEGLDVRCKKADWTAAGAVEDAIEDVKAACGRVHSIFCAAGPPVPFRRMVDFTVEETERFITEDAFAINRLVRASVHEMRQSGGGSITICTTMANDRVLDFDGLSAVSKGAVESLCRQVAAEEGLRGIRLNTVGVAWISEKSIEQVLPMLPEISLYPETPAEMSAHLLKSHARRSRIGRNAKPDEAGFIFAFLASDQAAYITGQRLLFDGGVTL